MATVAQDIQCLHEFFEAQVDLRPGDPAIVCGDDVYSYEEIEHRANQLARHLRDCGAGPGSLVGIYFERSARPIIAVLACLKAGAAYVPLDPEYPTERMRHILDEAEAPVLLTEACLASKAAAAFDGRIISVDADAQEIADQSAE
ncbi:MAG: AMP-binding protein, partial [Pirellulales bacterium]|nr:AMP-binding protein [Pirellulales bacterium]